MNTAYESNKIQNALFPHKALLDMGMTEFDLDYFEIQGILQIEPERRWGLLRSGSEDSTSIYSGKHIR